MNAVIFFALVALSTAAKLPGEFVEVLQDIRDGPIEAIYNNVLELDNGVLIEESGAPGSVGQSNKQGSYTFISPEGETYSTSFVADENGFQPQGDHLPQDHPLPAHAIEQLAIAERQRAEGIQFDERGFRI